MRRELSAASAAVVVAPKLNRKALEITASSSPIATSAGEGSLDPLAHAEPVEQAMPAWSSAMNSACRSRPTKAMFDVCGSRGEAAPTTSDLGQPAWIVLSN